MDANIDLNLVAMFVAVADASSFSRAAQSLGVPTSTVSRGVSRLEGILGIEILRRTTRQVSLTPEGAGLYERSSPALAAMRAALVAVPENVEPKGPLRITAAPDVGATFLADAVTRFTTRYPAVRFDVWITGRTVDLVAGGFDAAIRATSRALQSSSLVARKLGPIEFRVFGSPSYLAARGTPRTIADLARHDWVAFRGWKHPRELLHVPLAARIVSDDFFFVREALRAGAGLGFLPTFLARPDVAAGQLVRALPNVCQRGGRLVMLHARAKQLPRRLVVFRDFLVEEFGRSLS